MNEVNNYNTFGAKTLGPLLWGYVNWLADNFRKEHIEKVYFFSRDGFIMKKAFDLVFPKEFDTFYLEVSRRSLRVPILWKDYSFENVLTMVAPSGMVALTSIFDAVGLDIEDYSEHLNTYGFDQSSVFYRKEIGSNAKLKKMYEALSGDIERRSKEEYDLLVDYLSQNSVSGKFAIVDIGWSGGMQRFLQTTLDTLGIDNDIYGYYTGVADFYTRNANICKLNLNGYLFDFSHNPNDVDIRSSFVGLYELMFLETKGSVKNYAKTADGRIVAVRYPYEYVIDGVELPEIERIRALQEGAIDYIKESLYREDTPLEKKELCCELIKAGTRPTHEAVRLFADFPFFDEGVMSALASPKSLFYYITHISELKHDLYQCRWKTAFLYRLFKLPINYQFFYEYLKSRS